MGFAGGQSGQALFLDGAASSDSQLKLLLCYHYTGCHFQ